MTITIEYEMVSELSDTFSGISDVLLHSGLSNAHGPGPKRRRGHEGPVHWWALDWWSCIRVRNVLGIRNLLNGIRIGV